MIRLGLIGCGAWGQKYPSAAMTSGGFVTHIAGKGFTPYGSCAHYSSKEWRKLLDATVDAFIVATPPDTHEEIVTTLLEAGRPVMVEKPFTLSVDSAIRIAEAATKSGAPLLINHQHLFAPAYETLRDRISYPCAVETWAGNRGPHRSYSALWDYGPHDVAMVLGLCPDGRPVHVYAASRESRTPGDQFQMVLVNTPTQARVHISNATEKVRRMKVTGPSPHGGWCMTYDALAHDQLTINGSSVRVDSERPLQRAIRHFTEAVRFGRVDWRFGGEIGVRVTEILERADAMTSTQPQAAF